MSLIFGETKVRLFSEGGVMITPSKLDPFYDSDLEGAALLCFEEAETAEEEDRQELDLRGQRFKEALRRRMMGCSVDELGLSIEDCRWGAEQARHAIDGPGWEIRFRTAAMRLQMIKIFGENTAANK